MYHIHLLQTGETRECVHVWFVHMPSSNGGCLSQTAAHCYKAPEEPLLWLCHALELSCLSPLWLGLIWGSFGQSSQLRALCSGFGEDAAYFPCVVWDNLTQPRQLFCTTRKGSFLPTQKWNLMDPSSPGVSFVLALCTVTLLLVSGRPCTAVPSFSCAKHQ